jgi:hypothetical protein
MWLVLTNKRFIFLELVIYCIVNHNLEILINLVLHLIKFLKEYYVA